MSASQRYHQFTKYSPEGLSRNARQPDWSKQPHPFKEYPAGVSTTIALKPYLQRSPAAASPEHEPGIPDPLPENLLWQRQRLSQLLFFSYGVTQVVPYPDRPFYLRAAPSAGGLYPAEIYLVSKGSTGVPAGLYNYQVRNHSLVRIWDESRWEALQRACFDSASLQEADLALVTTAVFYRSAWRYEDRAYRRVCLDTGHLLGNITLGSNLTGYRPCLIGGFCDEAIETLLFLQGQEEGALVVMALLDLWPDPRQPLEGYPQLSWPEVGFRALPSPVADDVPDLGSGEWLSYLHRASRLPASPPAPPAIDSDLVAWDKYNFPFCLKVSTQVEPIDWGDHLQSLVRSILERRSTREFSGDDLQLGDLLSILDFTYHPEHYVGQGLDPQPDYFDLSLIETFVVANGVKGLEAGCYYYAPRAEELRQIRFKQFRQETHYLCLGQDLGRDAGAIIFHTADLEQATARYGERAYRYLHLDAGHLGQQINLTAVRLGLGVSGIAGFFDDQVNEVLGIPASEAVLYLTTLGCRRP